MELGFLMVPLVTLAFGITEFGRAIYSYNALTKASRDAARYLTSRTPGDPNEHGRAKCLVVYGNPNCAGTALATGLTTSMVNTCDAVLTCGGVTSTLSTGTGTINTVLVRVSGYPYDSFVEFVMPDISFNNISVTMRSQL